jgi:hypothetical protein
MISIMSCASRVPLENARPSRPICREGALCSRSSFDWALTDVRVNSNNDSRQIAQYFIDQIIKRVIELTANNENGVGEPIPISGYFLRKDAVSAYTMQKWKGKKTV